MWTWISGVGSNWTLGSPLVRKLVDRQRECVFGPILALQAVMAVAVLEARQVRDSCCSVEGSKGSAINFRNDAARLVDGK